MPRKSRQRYWLIGEHPDIGWHAWQRGPVMEGAVLVRIKFHKRPGRRIVFAGWDTDLRRFVVQSYEKKRFLRNARRKAEKRKYV